MFTDIFEMKRRTIGIKAVLLSISLLISSLSYGQDNGSVLDQEDTIKKYSIEELWVVDSPKESRVLRDQPLSSTILQREAMEDNRVFSIKNLSGIVPNLYIPDYGTKYTSSIYVRGIGSRINSPAVGIYVDGLPYFDKSGFDFDFSDIERVEVLRGPQGTLYGRNTMGGLINLRTKSPFDYSGTDLMLSAATKNGYRAYLTHYHRISDKFAFSAGGFYDYSGGFYRNEYDGKKIDKGSSAGGRMHGIWRPSGALSFDLNVSYEYDDDGGYPYGAYDKASGEYSDPDYNFRSTYRRNMVNAGLITTYSPRSLGITITSTSGWQYLKDRMTMDTDYSPADRFTMNQNQLQNTVSQEVILKGKWNEFWGGMDFSTGISGFYQWNRNRTPLTFGSAFISDLQATMDAAMIHSPVKVKLTDERMDVPGLFHLPTYGGALFHQSVFYGIFGIHNLSATLAIRLDYEKNSIDYASGTAMNYLMTMPGGRKSEGTYKVEYLGKQYQESMPVLPRLAITYNFNDRSNIYVMSSRGYRSGGFNIQMLSDYMQSDVQKNVGTLENDETINEALRYKPEFAWNHELGGHFGNGSFRMDFSLFYIKIKDQQVSRFVESGMGRYTSNAGKSLSYGGEMSLIYNPVYGLNLIADYGYTNAKFTKNLTQVVVTKDGKRVLEERDYKDKYVPFAPKHTLRLAASYSIDLGQSSKLTFGADYTGLGKIYFTEANDVSQKFYGLVNGRVSFSYGKNEISLWCNNIFNKDYSLFYFDSGSAGFMQKGKGTWAGIDLRLRF